MNSKNNETLTVRVVDFNLAARLPDFLDKLRSMTIHADSGMNCAMDELLERVIKRRVDCKLLLAYQGLEIVGWAMITNENLNFRFAVSFDSFVPEYGTLFQVYVEPKYRQQGIATVLFNKAQKMIGKHTICVSPWDSKGEALFNKFDQSLLRFL